VSCDPAKVKIGHQGCCSINDAADARLVAAHLGIPLYVCNFKKDFGRIIDYFVDEYAERRTPNPCVRCNDWLKFGKLHEYAEQIGADAVASGHYARVDHERRTLLRGVDHGKDQSYVLFGVPRDRSGHAPADRFVHQARDPGSPASGISRSSTSPTARRSASSRTTTTRASSSAAAPTSPGTPGGRARSPTPGHRAGRARGPAPLHDRAAPRRGRGAGAPDLRDRQGPAHEHRDSAPSTGTTPSPSPAEARIVDPLPDDAGTPSGRRGRFEVRFEAPERAVTPGQAIVLYDDDDAVLAGGWIESAAR
jgi:tRNA-specific 2-thiouridylase